VKAFRFLRSRIRRYLGILALAILCMLLLVGVELVAPWLVRTMISALQSGASLEATMALVGRLALLALVVYLLRSVLQFGRSYLSHSAGWSVVAEVREQVYAHLQRLSLGFYEDKQTGHLMSRTVNDSDMLERLIAHAIPDILVNVLTLVGVSAVLLSMNWRLTLLCMIPMPLIVVAMRGYARYVRPRFRERQRELGELNAALADSLSGMREIQAFTREHSQARRIGLHIRRYKSSMLAALRLMATFQPFVSLSAALGTVLIIYFGGRMASRQVLSIGDLVAFFLYLSLFYNPVQVLSTAWESIQEALAGAERVAELLDERPQVQDRPGAVRLRERARGGLEFRHVGFRYARGGMVLQDIDLSIAPRSLVALVGPTGVGKTTLVSLVPRFYEVTEGAVLLDGRDIRELTLQSLRSQVGIVSQDVFLFHGTVRDNILFGRPGACDEEMIEAARVANADGFIVELADGYDTFIGERGVKLSGGQKQRLAIARAVLKDAPILILDEATSSVDAETELLIQEALARLMAHRTSIVIAHRLSTVRHADLIVVLEGNCISQSGTHEELLQQEGLYRKLVQVQRGDFISRPRRGLTVPPDLYTQQNGRSLS
jgi:ATP-binding cassette subfamily B protein